MQLALYQRYYCRVARGWALVVKVMGLERQLGLMAPAVHLFNQEHTVSMVKRRHMAADMDLMPHVLAALTVLHQDLELEVLALDRAASGKQDLELAVLDSVKALLLAQA